MENDLVTMEILGTKSLTQRHCLGVGVGVCVCLRPLCVCIRGDGGDTPLASVTH